MDIAERKRAARSEAVLRRNDMTADARAEKSELICDRLLEALEQHLGEGPAQPVVLVYMPMKTEVDIDGFIRGVYERAWRVAFPCMMVQAGSSLRTFADRPRQTMRFRFVSQDAYENGSADFLYHPLRSYTARSPELDSCPPCTAEEADAVIVPLVAFDAQNNRLGYGGGNYDRFLPKLRSDAIVVGVAFSEQQLDAVPVEEHDRPLPRIITA